MCSQNVVRRVTFESWVDLFPVLSGALPSVLTEGHLQGEHGDAKQQQARRVGDKERAW